MKCTQITDTVTEVTVLDSLCLNYCVGDTFKVLSSCIHLELTKPSQDNHLLSFKERYLGLQRPLSPLGSQVQLKSVEIVPVKLQFYKIVICSSLLV